MKISFMFLTILVLSSCVVAGEFDENRLELHSTNNDICQTQPDKCVNGIPW